MLATGPREGPGFGAACGPIVGDGPLAAPSLDQLEDDDPAAFVFFFALIAAARRRVVIQGQFEAGAALIFLPHALLLLTLSDLLDDERG